MDSIHPSQETLRLAESLGITPKRSLGQNFLIDSYAIEKICNETFVEMKNHKSQTLIEIGPGLGSLTNSLKKNYKPILIELDNKLAEYWRTNDFEVYSQDALKVNWEDIFNKAKTCLISNLPYQISSRLVVELSLYQNSFAFMILMFQKEVAKRLLAQPRTEDYGMLTVVAQTFWQIENFMELSPKMFWPAPKVASRVVKFHQRIYPENEFDQDMRKKYLNFLKVAFENRRKLLHKALDRWVMQSLKKKIHSMPLLIELKINEKARAEDLSWSQYVLLFKKMTGVV